MFTVIIVVCLLKRMCMPSFILIGCCVSELHGHLCPYRNVLPEAVYCCFTRTTLLQKRNFPIPWSLWISISTQSFVSQLCTVFELKLKKKKKKNDNNNNKMKNSENERLQF